MGMAAQFSFTFNGAYLKAIVNAYRQIADSFVFHFTREDVKANVMSLDHSRAIQIILTPLDYRAYQDEAWVRGGMTLLWGAVKKLRKRDTVSVRVEDDKFYVGPIQAGDVVPEGEIFDEEKFKPPEVVELGSLHVVVSGFKKILRSAPPDTEFIGFDIDEPGGHIVLGDSVVDLREPHEWLLAVRGKVREAYTLELLIPLLVSGLIEDAYIRITKEGPAIIEYAEAQSDVRFYTAPVTDGATVIARILEKPRPVRTEILSMWVRVGSLFKAVKAIEYLTVYDEVTIDPSEGLGLFWKEGYLKVPSTYLETWAPPSEPVAGDFRIEDLVRFLKDVEDLRLYMDEVEGVKRFVLRGTGPKIAPKELEAFEMKTKIEFPEVVADVILSGPVDLLLRTVEDAKVAEDVYLVFYTTPYEIEAFGQNEVYYEATFELDDFQVREEDYIPIGSDAFSELIGFFKNVPADWCGLGKTEKNDIYLSCAADIGEFRAIKTNYRVTEAIKAYMDRVKRPVAPPEAEKLPEAPPPPPIERVTVYALKYLPQIVGVDMKTYGPFKKGEGAWLPRENAEALVKGGVASWEKPPVEVPPPPLKLLDPAKSELDEFRSVSRGPFRFVLLNAGEIRVSSMGRFLTKEELEARPEVLEEAQGYFLEELETLGIKPPAFELVTVYPFTHINQFTGVDNRLYGPFEAGEAALIPRKNADKFVKERFASWTKPPPPPVMRTYVELEKEFEEKDPWDALSIFVSRFEGLKRDYLLEDLYRFLRGLRGRMATEDVYRFYKIYPQLEKDFVSIASMIGWIPPTPPLPPVKVPPPRRPPPTRLKPDEVEEVWEQFVAFAKLAEIVEPLVYRDRFMETIRTSPTVANAVERARRLVSKIKREIVPPPPKAPPIPAIMPSPEDVAEVYRRLRIPPGAKVSETAFQTVWRAILRERNLLPPPGLIRSELDYLWREFADFLRRFDMDPERYRAEFDAVIDPDFNLTDNLDSVMKKVHELTDSERWGPERWR